MKYSILRYCVFLVIVSLFGLTSFSCRKLANLRSIRNQNPFQKKLPDRVIEVGPVLGYAGATELNISLKTDDDARVILQIDGRKLVSSAEKYHSFHIADLEPGLIYKYRFDILELEDEKRHLVTDYFTTRTFPAVGERIKFCVYGDLRTQPEIWAKTASAMLKENPDFGLMLGDLVRTGADKREWRTNFFEPGADFFSSVPQYIAKGDHDVGGERWIKLFKSPGNGENWSQETGLVHIVGVNLMDNWSAGGHLAEWLDSVLRSSKSPYVFVALHAPPYSSTHYGSPASESEHANILVSRCRDNILPIIERNKVTALFAGHVHAYERSELPNSLTVVTSGGAGAPLHDKVASSQKNNSYSRFFSSTYHYVVCKADRKKCSMQVINLNGYVIDSRTWNPIKR